MQNGLSASRRDGSDNELTVVVPTDLNLIGLESVFLGDPHCLAIAVHEDSAEHVNASFRLITRVYARVRATKPARLPDAPWRGRPAASARREVANASKWARYYDLVMALLTFGKEKKLRQTELEFCKLQPGKRVLEIGCGTGTLTLAAKDRVGVSGEVIGLDLAPEMIEKARSKATRKNVDVSFRQGSIASIPFPSGHFDAVLCSFMILHMPEDVRKSGIVEIRRVLKPGGQLCIIDGESLDALAANLNENSFAETQQEESKFGYMKLHFLRAKAVNA